MRIEFPSALIAGTYDLVRVILSFGLDYPLKRIALRAAGSFAARRHLDLGTGTGVLLGESAATLRVGMDKDICMLRRAKLRHSRSFVVAGDVTSMPFKKQSFDIITASYLVRYLSDLDAFARNVRVLFRPEGILWIYDLCEPRLPLLRSLFRMYLIVGTTLMGILVHWDATSYWHLWQSLRYFHPGDMARHLSVSGFDETQIGRLGVMAWITGRVESLRRVDDQRG